MSLRIGVLFLLVGACAPRGPLSLSAAQLQSRATRTIQAPFDELYDATWLTLEAAGWTVQEHDRRAGTLKTIPVGEPSGMSRAWVATVSQEGVSVQLTLLPRVYLGEREVTEQLRWTLDGPDSDGERWDTLFGSVTSLVEAWRVHPELVMSKTRGELDAAGLRLLVPSWQHFEFSTDRRTLVMQQAGAGGVPSLLYRVERRRPDPDLDALILETLGRAFRAEGNLELPGKWELLKDAWGEAALGEVRIGANLTPHPVRWRRWEAGNPAWVVRVAAACPDDSSPCEADVRRVIESAVNTAPVPGTRGR